MEKNIWLYKWDYRRYDFKKLNKLLNIVVKILNKKNERKITKNQLISEMYNINFEEQ